MVACKFGEFVCYIDVLEDGPFIAILMDCLSEHGDYPLFPPCKVELLQSGD